MTKTRISASATAVQKALAKTESLPGAYDVDDELVSDLMAYIRRYMVLTDAQIFILALWIIHTHNIEAAQQTPYLSITSPVKQCGKTRLLEILTFTCHEAWQTILPSEAVLYRYIDWKRPTLLLDEADAIFNPKLADRYEHLRGLLNEGNHKGAVIPRCVGTSYKPVEFSVFCAKALAGIGTLPDTVADRAIPIRLSRKTRDEPVERFYKREAEPLGHDLRDRAYAWSEEYEDKLQDMHPPMPDSLSDRMQESCEILVAIAEIAGCGDLARRALMEIFGVERLDDRENVSLRLLRDIRTAFDKGASNRLTTTELLERLNGDPDGPWKTYYGRGFDARDLGAFLRQYDIRSTTVNIGGSARAKGFKREDFHDAWTRYL